MKNNRTNSDKDTTSGEKDDTNSTPFVVAEHLQASWTSSGKITLDNVSFTVDKVRDIGRVNN